MTKTPVILIVEDDEWLAEQHIRQLREAGFLTEHVPHAIAAIDIVDSKRPAVIVLDIFLAGPNAFTLLHELQSHSDLAGIPVVICSNSAEDIASEDLEAYGITQVLDKTTMKPQDIVAAVKKVLS